MWLECIGVLSGKCRFYCRTYQFEPVGAITSHVSDSEGNDSNSGNGRLESTNWYVYNGTHQFQ